MLKYRNRLLAAASVIVTAGTVAVSGLTGASASPASRPSVSRTEHFQIMTTSATSNKASIIATGSAFTAGGVDHQGNRVDNNVFPGGTIKIRHFNGTGTSRFNPKTCLGVINQHGKYKIVGGTGKYAGISGHGRYQLSILFVGARNSNGTCSQRKAPLAFQQIIKVRGPVKL